MKPLKKCTFLWTLFFAPFLFPYSGEGIKIKVHAGAGAPKQDYLGTYAVTGLGLTMPLEQRLTLSFDLGYWDVPIEEVPTKFYAGRLKLFPVEASLQYSLSRQERVNPYVFLGCGYVFCSFAVQDIITIPEISIDQDLKNGPVFQAGLGIDAAISRSLGAFAEAMYFHRKTTGVTTITDLNYGTSTQEFRLNLQAWIFQAGIKYFFS